LNLLGKFVFWSIFIHQVASARIKLLLHQPQPDAQRAGFWQLFEAGKVALRERRVVGELPTALPNSNTIYQAVALKVKNIVAVTVRGVECQMVVQAKALNLVP
jgi:hypothetical protein